MALLLALFVSFALASDDELRAAIQRQEAIVDGLAAQVAEGRSIGLSRQELAARMSKYRSEAERLAAIEAPLSRSSADAEGEAHSAAQRKLADVLANDKVDEASRAALTSWLGEPAARIGVFETIAAQTLTTADPVVRRALALDLAEQAGALGLVCRYDAAKARRDETRATAQASALRARTAPGQSGGLDLVVAAERAERDALEANARVIVAGLLATRFEIVRTQGLTSSEGTP